MTWRCRLHHHSDEGQSLHPSHTDAPTRDARRGYQPLTLQSAILGQLRQRIPPVQLGLGEETSSYASQPAVEHLASLEPVRHRRVASALPREGASQVAAVSRPMHFMRDRAEFTQPAPCHLFTGRGFDGWPSAIKWIRRQVLHIR